jgi:mRNA interferase HigB
MQIIARRTLLEFCKKHRHAERPLRAWYKVVTAARWSGPADVKTQFGANVDFVGDNRIIFDIGGNKYRLVVRVTYGPFYRVLIKFIGTHKAYDKINPETV